MSAKVPAMRPTDVPLAEVLNRATGPRRAEVDELLELHAAVSGESPVVWANRIVGFGEHHYQYESGHSGVSPLLAFAPGASKHTIYLVNDFSDRWPDLVERLGPHRASKACLYLPRLTHIDRAALRSLLELSRDDSLGREATRD